MIVVCTFWWRKCIACLWQRGSQLPECVYCTVRRQWSKNQMTNYNCTHTNLRFSCQRKNCDDSSDGGWAVKEHVSSTRCLGFETASFCFISMPRRFSQAVTCVFSMSDSVAFRSSWKRQWTWSRKLQDGLEIFSVCRTDGRKVYIKSETAVMRYRKCTLCAAVVTGNHRIWCSQASQALITTRACVLPCLSVSLLRLRVQTHWNRPDQTRPDKCDSSELSAG